MKEIDIDHMVKKIYCSATSKRTGKPCQAAAERGCKVCRFHGARAGGPKGKAHGRYKHGLRTQEFIREQRLLKEVLRQSKETLAAIA